MNNKMPRFWGELNVYCNGHYACFHFAIFEWKWMVKSLIHVNTSCLSALSLRKHSEIYMLLHVSICGLVPQVSLFSVWRCFKHFIKF